MQESIVQALPASRCNVDTARHQSPSKQRTRGIQSQANPTPPSSRCTRSQAAPDWTVQEILVLLNEIAAIDEDWLKELSSYQRWKMLSDSCMAMNVVRSSNHCKRKWEMLLDDYMKIRKWESLSRENSYWFLQEDRRKDFRLPASFQKEVFDAMNAVVQVQKHQSNSRNSDPDRIIIVPEFENSDADSDAKIITIPKVEDLIMTSKGQEVEDIPKVEELTMTSKEVIDLANTSNISDVKYFNTASKCPPKSTSVEELIKNTKNLEVEELNLISKNPAKMRALTGKLRGSAEHVCAILRGELPDGAGHCPTALLDPTKCTIPSEFARRQADELIRALAGLTNSLDEFAELINKAVS